MLGAFLLVFTALAAQDFDKQRAALVREEIEPRGIKNPAVIKAMRETPRHLFVPQSVRSQAYEDHPLAIGHGQTISQPSLVAMMTDLLDPAPGHRVLEIGTGSGYQAAILARLVKEVYTIEIVEPLGRAAQRLLQSQGHHNVQVRIGDGYRGWPEMAPFDRIILTAAPPEVPRALLDQLQPGGKLVAPVGRTPFDQELVLITKDGKGRITTRRVLPVRFVPMVPGK
jgi:protein-L-isoaspartate(D-aspartate) O-methyltransferase